MDAFSPQLRGVWLYAARLIWITLIGLTLVIIIAAIPAGYESEVAFAGQFVHLPLPVALAALYFLAVQLIFAAGCIASAGVIFWQRSNNWVALLVSLIGGMFAANIPIVFELHQTQISWQGPIMAVIFFSQVAGLVVNFVFPDGRFVPRWAWVPAALLCAWYVASLLFPGAPFSPERIPVPISFAMVLIFGGAAIFSQVYRYRRVSTPAQRQQTKWVLFGITIAILGFIGAEMVSFVPRLSQSILYQLLFRPVCRLSILVAPLSLLISILRYRLWDIDFVINRSLVYGMLTGLLLALLALSLYAVALIFESSASGPLVAVAVSSAIFGAIFQPAHRRLQRFVDRRLYHIHVDYQKPPRPAMAPQDITAILKKTRFGEYQGMELIGHGGMAEVYKAIHPTLGQPVAIKLLPAQRAADPQFRLRFQREAQAVAQLQHPHIIHLFDFGQENGMYYIVMEYINGPALDRWMQESGRLTLEQALPVIRQIASALDYAHQQGLVHRDVKPSNVMLASPEPPDNSGFRAVLMDFGIAKLPGAHTALTDTGTLGTFDYIAPEQIQASAQVDGRADVYAFGVMAYQMLTGELPFKSSNPGALLIAHLTTPPPDPRKLASGLTDQTAQALLRALAKRPDERFSTAGEFAAALG